MHGAVYYLLTNLFDVLLSLVQLPSSVKYDFYFLWDLWFFWIVPFFYESKGGNDYPRYLILHCLDFPPVSACMVPYCRIVEHRWSNYCVIYCVFVPQVKLAAHLVEEIKNLRDGFTFVWRVDLPCQYFVPYNPKYFTCCSHSIISLFSSILYDETIHVPWSKLLSLGLICVIYFIVQFSKFLVSFGFFS